MSPLPFETLLARTLARRAAHRDLSRHMADLHRRLAASGQIEAPPTPARRVAWVPLAYAAAAGLGLALLAGGLWQWQGHQRQVHLEALYAAHFEQPDVRIVQGARGPEDDTRWQAAYAQGDWPQTIALAEACLAARACPPVTAVYLGTAYLHTGEPALAVPPLRRALLPEAGMSAPRRNFASLYLAWAYIRLRQPDSARAVLQRMDTTIHIPETQTGLLLLKHL